MINSNINGNIPCGSSQVQENDKRLDAIEATLKGQQENFSSTNISSDKLTTNEASIGKAKINAIDATSIKVHDINATNIDIDGPITLKEINVTTTVNARELNVDDAHANDIFATNVNTSNATIDNLTVGQIESKDGNMMVPNLTVNNVASIHKLNLGDPNIDAITTKVLASDTANITQGNITHLGGVDDENVREINLGEKIVKANSVDKILLKSIGNTAMQVGDIDNQVILACDSRPLWNDKVLATLDDLGPKIIPAYQGRVTTEANLPTENLTLGDYYIITTLTKGDRVGIGYALYNGVQFDTDFFYELEGYRLAADQDKIDNAQDTAIANEIARAKGKEQDIFVNGVRKIQATPIAGNQINIDDLFGVTHFGERYTGLGKDFIDGTLPAGEEGATGFCLDILPNGHNTVQVYYVNHPDAARMYIRSYGNDTWTDWVRVAMMTDKAADSEKLDGNNLAQLRQMIFDDAHPINDTFVSNDGGDDPNKIYNINGITSTWTYVGQSFGIHGWRRTK